MAPRSFFDVAVESFQRDEIREKDVSKEGGKEKVESVFDDALSDF